MSSRYAHFFPSAARNSGSYFLGTPARSARTWVTVSQKISSTFSLDRPTTSIFGTPASSRRTTVASGSASPVHHSWRMAKEATGRDRLRAFAFSHHCERYHYGNCFLIMDILASNF